MEDMLQDIECFIPLRSLEEHALWLIAFSILSLLAIKFCLMARIALIVNSVTRVSSRV